MVINWTKYNKKQIQKIEAKARIMCKSHKWFAWYPVKIGIWEIAWLQYVKRQYEYTQSFDSPFMRRYWKPKYESYNPKLSSE